MSEMENARCVVVKANGSILPVQHIRIAPIAMVQENVKFVMVLGLLESIIIKSKSTRHGGYTLSVVYYEY